MKNKNKNTREKFEKELNDATNRFLNLEIGNNQDLHKLTPGEINNMCSEIENWYLDLSDDRDINKLAKIIKSYENDSRLTVYYDGQAIGKILTNKNLNMPEALSFFDIDFTEEENGESVWDYDLFSFEV